MFIEVLENKAENDQVSEFTFPVLVGSKKDNSTAHFANVQLFANVLVEGASLNTDTVYLEATGQVGDTPFHVQNSNVLQWVSLTDYAPNYVASLITGHLSTLRLDLCDQILKKLPLSKVIDSAMGREFLSAIQNCYPDVDSFSTFQIESLPCGDNRSIDRFDIFNHVSCITSQAEALLFDELEKAVSSDHFKNIKRFYISI